MATTRSRTHGREHARPSTGGAAAEHATKIYGVATVGIVVIVAFLALTSIGHVIDAATQHFMLFYAGVFALIGLCASVGLGLVATDRMLLNPGHRVFVQAAHRAISFGAVAFLIVHIATEILAQRVHAIDAVVPFLSPFRTFYIGLGTISSDLLILLAITGIMRGRFNANAKAWRWRAIHYTSYLAFVFGVWHGLLGGRPGKPYVDWSYGFVVAFVLLGLAVRVLSNSLRPKENLSAPPVDIAANAASAPLRAAAMYAQSAATRNARSGQLGMATGGQPMLTATATVTTPVLTALPAGNSIDEPAAQPFYEPGYVGPPRYLGAPAATETGPMPRVATGPMPRAATGSLPAVGIGSQAPADTGPMPRAATGGFPALGRTSTGPIPRAGTGGFPMIPDGFAEMPTPPQGRPATGPMPRANTGGMPRVAASGPMPRAGTGPMPRAGTGPLPRAATGPIPRASTGPIQRPQTGPIPRTPAGPPSGPMPRAGSGPMPRPGTGGFPSIPGGYPEIPPPPQGRPATGPIPRAGTGPQQRPGTGPMPRAGTGPQQRPVTGPMDLGPIAYDLGPGSYNVGPHGAGLSDRGSDGPGRRPPTGPLPRHPSGPIDFGDPVPSGPMPAAPRPATGPMPRTPDRGERQYPYGAQPYAAWQDTTWQDTSVWQGSAPTDGGSYPGEQHWDGLPGSDPSLKYRDPGPGMPGYRGPREPRYGGDRY